MGKKQAFPIVTLGLAVACVLGASIAGNAAESLFESSALAAVFWVMYILAPVLLLLSTLGGAHLFKKVVRPIAYLLGLSAWLAIASFWSMGALIGQEGTLSENLMLALGAIFAVSSIGAVVFAIILAIRVTQKTPSV